ncbi:MAG: DMT family transporter [Pseudomonadota bacterium]|nr:DMT family transporter [Pseudomonadota bacterium]
MNTAPLNPDHPHRGRCLAYFLLALAALFFALNTNIARASADEVPPLALTFWRLFLSALILAPFTAKHCWQNRAAIKQYFWLLSLFAALQMTIFNALVYVGVNYTQAINANLLQGSLPICILVASVMFVRQRITYCQWTGVLLGLVGLVWIVIRGDPLRLLTLEINLGDPLVFFGVFASATYTTILFRRPPEIQLTPFIFLLLLFGSIQIFPFFLWEHFTHRALPITYTSIGTVLFMAVFASVLAQLFFAEGIRRIGAPAGGNVIYLTPVFGVIIAIILLGEVFQLFHAIGIMLIAAGIWLAVFLGQKSKPT